MAGVRKRVKVTMTHKRLVNEFCLYRARYNNFRRQLEKMDDNDPNKPRLYDYVREIYGVCRYLGMTLQLSPRAMSFKGKQIYAKRD